MGMKRFVPRYLDPASRLGEILFGLIAVRTRVTIGARRASSGAPISLMADLSSLVDEIQFAKAGRSTANCRRLGYAENKLCVVVNRYQSADVLPLKDAEDLLKWKIFWHLPNDYRLSSAALTKGVPIAIEDPGSKLARSYRDLAIKLGGADAQDADQSSTNGRRNASVIRTWFGMERRANVT